MATQNREPNTTVPFKGLPFREKTPTLVPYSKSMKSILIFALLLTLGTVFLSGCTTVPKDTTVRRDVSSSSTSTYSK